MSINSNEEIHVKNDIEANNVPLNYPSGSIEPSAILFADRKK